MIWDRVELWWAHNFKSNSITLYSKAHLIPGSQRIISYSNLIEILAKSERFRPYNERFLPKKVFAKIMFHLPS